MDTPDLSAIPSYSCATAMLSSPSQLLFTNAVSHSSVVRFAALRAAPEINRVILKSS
jgi:hypothetical protein